MKNVLFILITFIGLYSFSQEKKVIYLSSEIFEVKDFIEDEKYLIYFYNTINSKEWDAFKFSIMINTPETKINNLIELGIDYNCKTALNIYSFDYFKSKNTCDIHNEFSDSDIVIVKEISRENDIIKYRLWKVNYDGTIRNVTFNFTSSYDSNIHSNFKRKL